MTSNLKCKISLSIIMFLLINLYINNEACGQNWNNFNTSQKVNTLHTDSASKLYIDPDKLTEEEKAIFIKALSDFSLKKEVFDQVKIEPFQNVSSIIKRKYNIIETINYEAASILKKTVKKLNDLNENYLVFQGDSLSVPIIPNNPKRGNSKSFTQVYDFVDNKSFISPTNSLINYDNRIVSQNIQQTEAGLWMYNLSKKDMQSILDSIPVEMQKKLYGEAFVTINKEPEFVEIYFPSSFETDSINADSKTISQPLNRKLSDIRSINFGTYYILDFFDGNNCTHGKKVLSVISQRLKEYGLDSLKINIVPIPINYFQNQDSAIIFLKRYYSSDRLSKLTKIEGEATISALKKIKDKNLKNCEICTPEIFIDACMKYYYGKMPDIISTSFYFTTYRDIMPNFVNSPTNLITACLDEPGRKIEDLQDRESTSNGSSNGAIQPLYSSWLNYARVGSIIVGCQIAEGKFYGMYSSDGNGITTLGRGIGWGSNQDCLNPAEKGTSYATPDVAIKLLIAKAYWRSKEFMPSAIEARTRLLLCTDIDSVFVGKFASAGQPNLYKLLVLSNGYTESTDGNISECNISGSIEFDQNSKLPFQRGINGISGLSFLGEKTYGFFETSLSWKLLDIKNVSIKLISNGIFESFTNIEQLKSSFKQIIKLKN